MMTDRALDHLDDSRRFDMREQVAQRAVATALAGLHLTPERIEIIARDILVWLDDYDADATQRAYTAGFRQGVAFAEFRRTEDGQC